MEDSPFMFDITPKELQVETLGPAERASPLRYGSPQCPEDKCYIDERVRIRADIEIAPDHLPSELSFEEAGPRQKIFFDPAGTTAAIVTCGGLSPGLNNVIRSAYYELAENYGVQRVLGIRNGYLGLTESSGLQAIKLNREYVDPIDKLGGTILGSSRGPQDPRVMADYLESLGVDILLCLGGDGTQRGAYDLSQEVARRNLPISIIGIPKTIDNDIPFVRQAFGYSTALEIAGEVIRAAHVEARDAPNGIGLVKLMGRHAGFIAAGATIVSQEVNYTLIPEIEFPLEGGNGLLASLEKRLKSRGHAVIVVAEGAGQHLFDDHSEVKDASGNKKSNDAAALLRERVPAYLRERGIEANLKYLDPSYHIRSVPANAADRILCDQLGRHAVHAGMAGKTGIMIGHEHNRFLHIPIPTVVARKKRLSTGGDLWRGVLQVTRQPRW